MRKSVSGLFVAAIAAFSIGAVAQEFPSRPLRMIVPFAPGGGADLVARLVAAPLGKRLGQQVIVENKPGGGGTLGAEIVTRAPADGYTLLYGTPGPQITNPYLMAKLPYDPEKDLLPVSELVILPSALVINKDLPFKSVKDLILYAKEHPGKLSFASAGIGASSHLAGELLKQTAGIDIVHVAYRGTGPAMQDLISGQVQMAIDSVSVYLPLIKAGTVHVIGVSSLDRVPMLPDVQPIDEEVHGFGDASPMNYIAVRSGTPQVIVDRLNAEINAVLRTPEVKAQMESRGMLVRGSTQAGIAALVRSESEKWKRVIQISGVKVQ